MPDPINNRINVATQLDYVPPAGQELGSRLDETLMELPPVSGGTTPAPPFNLVRRTRILLAGDQNYDEIVRVKNTTLLNGAEYGLITRNLPVLPEGYFNVSSTVSGVAYNTQTDIVSHVVSPNTQYFITGFSASSNAYNNNYFQADSGSTVYELYINDGTQNLPIMYLNGSPNNPNVHINFNNPILSAVVGETIGVRGIHQTQSGTTAVNMHATIFGFEGDA